MMKNELITVFTPVYNRESMIMGLYKSLLKQTNKKFIWLIVDDGSTDNTWNVIERIRAEQKITVIATREKNQGKHVAHNLGVKLCETKLFVCVDSDDTLVPSCIQDIYNYYESHKQEINDQIAGIIAWKGFSEKRKIGKMPDCIVTSSLTDLYKVYHMTGDTMLIFRTEVIREYPFPHFEGETFLRETLSYNRIDDNYKYLIMNKILYIADYYEDGLSVNAPRLELRSPRGAAMFRWEEYKDSRTFKNKMRNLTAYIFFNRLAGNNRESIDRLKILFIPCWILSWYGYIYYAKFFSEN